MAEAGSKELLNYLERGDPEQTQHKLYRCELCNILIKGYDKLKAHQVVCEKRYCYVCKKTFHSEGTFRKHLRTNCPPRRYSCSKCSKTFARNSDCSAHQKGCPGQPKQECLNCGVVFMTRQLLTNHQCNMQPFNNPVPTSTTSIEMQSPEDQTLALPVTSTSIPVKTLVFFDLETTGLIENDKFPEITELALVAVHRENLTNPATQHTPRVLDKLRLTLRPRHPVSYTSTFITGKLTVMVEVCFKAYLYSQMH